MSDNKQTDRIIDGLTDEQIESVVRSNLFQRGLAYQRLEQLADKAEANDSDAINDRPGDRTGVIVEADIPLAIVYHGHEAVGYVGVPEDGQE